MPKLVDLELKGRLTVSASSFKDFQNLRFLCLDSTSLSEIPISICELKNLEVLSLKYNNISELPPEITQLTNLRHLLLQDNPILNNKAEIKHLRKLMKKCKIPFECNYHYSMYRVGKG